MPAIDIDPYRSSDGLFECVGCGSRTESASHPGTCPNCDSPVQNISVSRE
ncbi:rubrerythrin-like domain-containing protein [Halobaculum lipolyticum]|uniref:Rubrerythrin-like domain-containing protein n=1 Tax=Halobaculum lipolyticum TaxID=3032001 RepID=A0ABD5WE00_9EURY|nr:rubrerythrin-like domain-containing protein [Halobaculum sp. DT31]